MKVMTVLLVVATLSSAALVASAQQSSYVIPPDGPQGQETAKTAVISIEQDSVVLPPAVSRRAAMFSYHPNGLAVPGEEMGLSNQAEQLAHQLAGAGSDSDRDKIKAQLAEILEKQFDQRQKRHGEELKALEAQVKKLKDLVDKRQENRRDIIRARLNQIEKEAQGLGW